MKRIATLLVLITATCVHAQTGAISGHCTQGSTQAKTSGLPSSNYMQGIVPQCQVAVFLTGTTNRATIYADGSNTPLSNPFIANPDGSWLFFALTTQGYDVTLSGGIAPNVYATPVTRNALYSLHAPFDGGTIHTPLIGTSANFSGNVVVPPIAPAIGGIVGWGDSLTAGREGVFDQGSYPTAILPLAGPVINQGVGGQTSTQIGVRQGGIPTYAQSVSGGAIPACPSLPCAGVTVTWLNGFQPTTTSTVNGSTGQSTGTIQSTPPVHGTITLAGGTYTFTPDLYAPAATATGQRQYVVDRPYLNYAEILWEGRNNLFSTSVGPFGCPQILSDLAGQVAIVPAAVPYLIVAITNSNSSSEWGPGAPGGAGANYATLIGCNASLLAAYPNNYYDVRSALVAAYNPNLPTDVADHANDEPPTSLRAVTGTGTLTTTIGTTDTTCAVSNIVLTVASGAVTVPYVLTLDAGDPALAENVAINAVSGGNTVTSCIRGYGGMPIVIHSAGAPYQINDGTHLNAQGYALVAQGIAAKLAAMTGPAVNRASLQSAIGSALGNSGFSVSDPGNTSAGVSALASISTGANDTAVGNSALVANTTGSSNTAVGSAALAQNTTGSSNNATGYQAMQSNTTGSFNVANGSFDLFANLTGIRNSGLGYTALEFNTTGNDNTGIGFQALLHNTTGSDNTGVGNGASIGNTTGLDNTAVGVSALSANQTGTGNVAVGGFSSSLNTVSNTTAVGMQALQNASTATFNTAVGYQALSTTTTGGSNTAVGYGSLGATTGTSNTAMGTSSGDGVTTGSNNTCLGYFTCIGANATNESTAVGSQALSNNAAANNTAVGSQALKTNTSGGSNTALGQVALAANVTGSNNTAVGRAALDSATGSNETGIGFFTLFNLTSGANNTALGYEAGYNPGVSLQTVASSVFLGYLANDSVDGLSNSIVIGASAQGTASNQVMLGNSSITSTVLHGIVSLPSQTAITSSATIAPTAQFFHVTGTTTINTITAPTSCTVASTMCQITMIPDGLAATGTSGNIAIASTFVVGKALIETYDPTTSKWYPSY